MFVASQWSSESKEQVVLVDTEDRVIGTEQKMRAHQLGLLHRAFSVFIYDTIDDETLFLLQQRHPDKYHCGGLWTNACCSHPRLDEPVLNAAHRRLEEELGIHATLQAIGKFQYKADFDNGLSEHELDHVLIGTYDSTKLIVPNPEEVLRLQWMSVPQILADHQAYPDRYTPWFETAFTMALEALCYKY